MALLTCGTLHAARIESGRQQPRAFTLSTAVFPKGSATSKHSSKSRLIHKQKRLEPCNPQALDAESARVLPIILATKLLPEMEAADAAALAAHRAAGRRRQRGGAVRRPAGAPERGPFP